MKPFTPTEATYTTNDVAQITGASQRQLQWWDEKGVLSPRLQGHRRYYTLTDIVRLTAISQLRRRGMSLQALRRLIRTTEFQKAANGSYIVMDASASTRRGRLMRVVAEPDHALEIALEATAPVHILLLTVQLR